MTLALCFNCGHTKFGAICPCEKCGVSSTGNVELDILFSDHHMSAESLDRLGEIVNTIHTLDDDPAVCFWVFMRYVSEHPADLLKADAPADLAERVEAVYAQADLPIAEIESRSPTAGLGPTTTLDVPDPLFAAFRQRHPFRFATQVQARLHDGRVLRGILAEEDQGIAALQKLSEGQPQDTSPPAMTGGQLELTGEHPDLKPTDLAALRPAPGCLGFLFKKPWVEST